MIDQPRLKGRVNDVWATLRHDHPGYSSGVMRTIWPAPAGNPNPKLETYRRPSGPKVIAVGRASPPAITFEVPDGSKRRTRPMNGIGNPPAGLISSTYIRSLPSNTTPRTVVKFEV